MTTANLLLNQCTNFENLLAYGDVTDKSLASWFFCGISYLTILMTFHRFFHLSIQLKLVDFINY